MNENLILMLSEGIKRWIDSKYREKLREQKNSFDEIIILKTIRETNVFEYLERKVFSEKNKKFRLLRKTEPISFIPLVLYLD